MTSASSWTSTWCAMPSARGTELDTLSQVISANLTRAALEAAPVIADLSSWLADVAGKAGIAWERLFDAPEEKSLRTLRYELDLASSTIEKLEGRIEELRELPTLGFNDIPRHRADQRAGTPSSTSCGAPAIRPRRGSPFWKGRPIPVHPLQDPHPLPTTPRACRTGPRTWSGSRASSRARCLASRTRAATGSSPSTSGGSPRSRRCGPGTQQRRAGRSADRAVGGGAGCAALAAARQGGRGRVVVRAMPDHDLRTLGARKACPGPARISG